MTRGLERVPRHVAIIMDGNRRFAKQLMLKPWKGHEWGAKKLQQVLEWCRDFGITELTVYAFSIQNFNRPEKEFNYLMDLFRHEYEAYYNEDKIKDIRINFLGRIGMFPRDITAKMEALMERTKHHRPYTLNFAMAYGGREEVIDATIRLAKDVVEGRLDVAKINEEVFEQRLYHASEPDLVIRTGGDHRTSNFLIWQANYAEWFFVDKKWPEFDKADFENCLVQFAERERRFGK